jgi:hypothetical protein
MSERSARTAPPRDVPPPRPVAPTPAPAEENGLGSAARAVAEAVAGLVGGGDPAPGSPGRGATGPATGLRDALGAVATAVGAALGGSRGDASAPGGPAAAPSGPERPTGAAFDELLAAVVPRLPVRDAARLRAAHPGGTDEEIAAALVARAVRATSGIGAATGWLAAAPRSGPASLLAVPLELGVETVLTAAVEIVLIGELHELHGRRAPGDARARGAAYLATWSGQRPAGSTGIASVLGAAGLRTLRRGVGRRLVRNVPTAAPLLLGAALAGRGNRRATETLAARVLRDLRG